MANFYVTAQFDDISAQDGYDGDSPLDPNKNWTPYTLFLHAYADDDDSEWTGTSRDCIGSVWVSDDDEGREHMLDVIGMYFCDKDDAERPSDVGDIDMYMP